TVMVLKIPRPSGTCAKPSAARASTGIAASDLPPNRIVPDQVGRRPDTVRIVVVLPAPFMPSRDTTPRSSTASFTSHRICARLYPDCRPSTSSNMWCPQVGFENFRVPHDVRGIPADEILAEVQNRRRVAEASHQFDVVLDDEHGHTRLLDD